MKTWLFPLWIIIDVLIFLASIALWITAPEYGTLNTALTVLGLALGGLLCVVKSEEIKVFIKSVYFRHLSFHIINAFLVAAILGLVNYLGNKNYKEFDLTSQKRNSLTAQTRKVLEMVKSPLEMTVYSKREDWQPILNVLKMYAAQNKLIDLKAIDTDLRPDLVKAKDISQNGTIIISYTGKESQFQITDELSVTNAILKTVNSRPINLYMTTGHQEINCSDKSDEGISALCEKLNSQNYIVKSLDLTQVKEVPKDATAVFILGPVSGFLPSEAKIVEDYLSGGGSLFLALAPSFKSDFFKNLTALAEPYGLTLGRDIVIDRLSTVQGAEATIPIISQYETNHPITTGFNLRTIFPLSSSVGIVKGKDAATLLAFTSRFPGSWAESDLKGLTDGKAVFEEGKDTKGPIGLLGVGESGSSRFVLLGSSSFLFNGYQSQSGNTTLFLNAASWMIGDEGIISFNRPGVEESPVLLSSQHLQLIFVIAILLVPIVFFGAAIFIYRRRRFL